MMKKKHPENFIIVVLALIALFPFVASAQSAFLMGEDVFHPGGLVMSVNSFSRSQYKSGLGSQGKQDEVFVNLTFVNNGQTNFRIDPLKDFSLELESSFSPQPDKDGKLTTNSFNIFPGTQSRIDLYFRIDSDQQEIPTLNFSIEGSSLRIFCEPELEKLLKKSNEMVLPTEDAARLGQVLLDSGRLALAEKIIRAALEQEPNNTRLLMQMAGIEDASFNRENAAFYLQQINLATINNVDEGVAIAKMAIRLGFYGLAVGVLEPLESTGRLSEDQRILLARSYYYEENNEATSRILLPLIQANTRDSSAYFTYANLMERTGNIQMAIDHWLKAVEMNPDYPEAFYNLGVGYYKMQRIQQAREAWEKVIRLSPDSETLRAAEDALKATEYE